MCHNSPEISFCHSCQTFSGPLEMSMKTVLIFNSSSNGLKIWEVIIDNNWLIRKSAGLKPDRVGEISLLARKMVDISLKISFYQNVYLKSDVEKLDDNF